MNARAAIAQACAVGLGTVSAYLARALAAGVAWPLPDDLQRFSLRCSAGLQACPIRRGQLYLSDLATAGKLSDDIPLVAGTPYTLEVAIRLKRTGIEATRDAPRTVTNLSHLR